jgi:hypothetical protein
MVLVIKPKWVSHDNTPIFSYVAMKFLNVSNSFEIINKFYLLKK